jgi:membrane protein
MIKHLESSGKSATSVIIGAITLLIGATTVFLEIQDSINMIWKVKVKPELGWAKLIRGRLLSSTLIVTVGFLMMVSLIVNGALMALSDMLTHFFPVITVVIFNILGIVLSFIITAMLFGVIYKVLPDVKVGWRDVGSGAIFTAVLFTIGRLGMSVYLEKSGAGSPYGAAGALIVILLWIYYTAAILYFGAEFTRAYADFTGAQIEPADYAVHVEEKEAGKTNVVSGEDKEEKNSQATTI